MKLTKTIAVVLAALMVCAMPFYAMAEETDTELEGFVTELVEGGFIMEDKELGQIMLNVDDATVLDGILLEEEISEGLYVLVQYDGRTTRSLPPQAHADKVGCYVLNGVVSEFLDNGILLTGDELFGDVIVHVEGSMKHIYPDVPVTVYYNGVMAMSLPGQVAAREIIVPELTGTVSELDEEGFMLTDAEGAEYRVIMNDKTLVGRLLPAGEEAAESTVTDHAAEKTERAAEETAAAGEIAAEEAAAREEKSAAEEKPAEAETAEASGSAEAGQSGGEAKDEVHSGIDYSLPIKNGDTVTVYYNGELDGGLTAAEAEAAAEDTVAGTEAEAAAETAAAAEAPAAEAEAAAETSAADKIEAGTEAEAADYPMQLIALEVVAVEAE